jgi:hypothetical protein
MFVGVFCVAFASLVDRFSIIGGRTNAPTCTTPFKKILTRGKLLRLGSAYVKMIVDKIVIFSTLVASVGAFFLPIEYVSDWFLVKVIKGCLDFPHTSRFTYVLEKKPIKAITVPNFSDAGLGDALYDEIKKDLNMKIYGLTGEILTVLRCLIYDREDIMLSSMDYIIIVKRRVEILFVENKEKGNYDRSLCIDLDTYRQAVFYYRLRVVAVVGSVAMCASGNEALRTFIMKVISYFLNVN